MRKWQEIPLVKRSLTSLDLKIQSQYWSQVTDNVKIKRSDGFEAIIQNKKD